jgi:hypothetical protein
MPYSCRFDEDRVIATKTSNPILSLDLTSDRRRVVSGGGDCRLAVSTLARADPPASAFPEVETQLLPLRNAGYIHLLLMSRNNGLIKRAWVQVLVRSNSDAMIEYSWVDTGMAPFEFTPRMIASSKQSLGETITKINFENKIIRWFCYSGIIERAYSQ